MSRDYIIEALREYAERCDLLDSLSPYQPLTEQLTARDITFILRRANQLRSKAIL